MTTDTLKQAAQALRDEAESLRECHTPSSDRSDWTGGELAHADYLRYVALAAALEAIAEQEPAAYIEHHKGGDNLVWDDPGGKNSALYAAPIATPESCALNVDELAQEIRRVDGNHDLGAGRLAEALMSFLRKHIATPEHDAKVRDAVNEAFEQAALIADQWASPEQRLYGNGGPAAAIRSLKSTGADHAK